MATVLTAEPKAAVSAVEMGARQREISVSEFFTKNRHLLGFDNPRKALLTCVKEAVDNALDAAEEAGILPDVVVRVEVAADNGSAPPPASQATRFRVTVTDNGPGIVRHQIPPIFAKLLYGSKFHRLRMSRGQQGIGISAAAMYGQLTTGKPMAVISRTGPRKKAVTMQVLIDTAANKPRTLDEHELAEWDLRHGTEIRVELEAQYLKGRQSVDEFLHQVAVANPHATLHYRPPSGEDVHWERTVEENPAAPKEIKPHPHGVELGVLMKMLQGTRQSTVSAFLSRDFSRVSPRLAGQILERAGIRVRARPKSILRREVDSLYQAINDPATRIMAPPTDCLSPIGMQELLAGLTRGVRAEFYTVETRKPAVYRGNPFQVEVGLAWGGDLPSDDLARLLRFANRVPLLYQAGACCVTKAVNEVAWKSYGLQHSRGALPTGPLIVLVHLASVWVPFSSESKEAVADYDEIRREIKLAVQACGRRLGQYVKRRQRARGEARRREAFNVYLEEVVRCVEGITGEPQPDFRDHLLRISNQKTQLAELLTELDAPEDGDQELASADNVLIVETGGAPEEVGEQATLDLG